MVSNKLFSLTRGERAWIRRRRFGLSQSEMADRLGMSRHLYVKRENEPRPGGKIPLTIAEQLCLHRRRSGLSQKEAAELLNVSRVWYNKLENDSASRESIGAAIEEIKNVGKTKMGNSKRGTRTGGHSASKRKS